MSCEYRDTNTLTGTRRRMEVERDLFSDLIAEIVDTLADVEFDQSGGDDRDYDGQFAKAYECFRRTAGDGFVEKLAVLFGANDSEGDEKSVEQSVAFREAGNKYFNAEKYGEALVCYNKSVFSAPCPDNMEEEEEAFVEFALSLVNRKGAEPKFEGEIFPICGLQKYLRHICLIEDESYYFG